MNKSKYNLILDRGLHKLGMHDSVLFHISELSELNKLYRNKHKINVICISEYIEASSDPPPP